MIPDNVFLLVLIQTTLVLYKELVWFSESTFSLQAVRLPWYKTLRWKAELPGIAHQRLNQQLRYDSSLGMRSLAHAFSGRTLISYVRASDEDEVGDLYILVPFGWYAVGIRTQIITD